MRYPHGLKQMHFPACVAPLPGNTVLRYATKDGGHDGSVL